MSTLPGNTDDPHNTAEDSELILGFVDNSWSVLNQELLQLGVNEATMHSVLDDINGSKAMNSTRNPSSKIRKKKENQEAGPSDTKKLDHNARERIRRMKTNASYLALRALLPDSRRSKKRWTAPAIVDRVLKYIPELANEVETMRSRKQDLQSEAKNKKINVNKTPKVLFNKVNEEEAVIQTSMSKEDYENGLGFTSLLQSMEDEGMILINGASTLHICESLICCNLHIQISGATYGDDDYIEQLSEKMISWMR